MSNNFEISLVVFVPNTTTNHAITYTNFFVLTYEYMYIILFTYSISAGIETWFVRRG